MVVAGGLWAAGGGAAGGRRRGSPLAALLLAAAAACLAASPVACGGVPGSLGLLPFVPRAAEAPAPLAAADEPGAAVHYPTNLTTLFKGSWSLAAGADAAESRWELGAAASGTVLVRLQSWETSVRVPAAVFVEGVASFRRSDAAGDDDVLLVLRGLYFPETGRLALDSVSYDDGDGEREAAANTTAARVGDDTHGVSLCEVSGEFQAGRLTEEEWAAAGPAGGSSVTGRTAVDPAAAARLNGTLRSKNCKFTLEAAVEPMNFREYYNKVGNYILVVSMISLGQIGLIVKQMQASASPARAARVSMFTVAMMALLDASVCLVHLMESVLMADPLFQAFVAMSFFQFFMFSVFELRFLLVIWKARRPDAFNQGWENLRREFSTLYSQFYGFIVLGLIVMYQGRDYLHLLAFPLLSMWVPQIVANAREDTNRALTPQFVLGMSATRLFLPLYVWGCPVNFFAFQTVIQRRPTLCVMLALWVAFQAAVLMLQDRLHARFFIPARFLPPKFDYHEIELAGVGDEEDGGGHTCPICYCEVDPEAERSENMRTPCNHVFHTECLTRWMEQKMECPTCRATLPPL